MVTLVPEHKMEWPTACALCGVRPIEDWITGPDGNPVGICGDCEPEGCVYCPDCREFVVLVRCNTFHHGGGQHYVCPDMVCPTCGADDLEGTP